MEVKRRTHRDIEEIPEDHTEKFWAWWEKWGLKALTLVAVVLAVVAIYRWIDASRRAAHERAWAELAGATSPESLRQVAADNAANPPVYALAQLRAGDLLLSRVLNPADTNAATTKPSAIPGLPGIGPAPRSPEDDRAADLKQAEDSYKAVVNSKDAPLVIQLNARLGLAAVAEMQGEWGKAREAYKETIKLAGDTYPLIKTQAVGREAMLDRLPGSLAFSPEKPPVVATQPSDLFPVPHFGVGTSTQPSN